MKTVNGFPGLTLCIREIYMDVYRLRLPLVLYLSLFWDQRTLSNLITIFDMTMTMRR